MHFFPVLALAPAVTATFASARRIALVGALAAVALVIAGTERSVLTTETVLVQMFSLVLLTVALVSFRYLRDRREGELIRVRLVSEAAQSVVMRPLPERAGPVSVACTYHAAGADTHIGGDFYALARTADSTRLIIGDVRGSGLAALSETAVLMESFRAASRQQLPLAELVSYLDGSVRWGLAEFARAEADLGERFATLAVADIPDSEPVVRLILCGHPPPLLLRQGTATPLTVPSPPRRWGWAHSPGTPTSRGPLTTRPATCCCSIPTASPRPEMPAAPSTRSRSVPPPGRTARPPS